MNLDSNSDDDLSLNELLEKISPAKQEHSLSVRFLCIFVILFSVVAIMRAYVAQTLWNWYISSYFHLPQATFAIAFGICLLLTFVTSTFPVTDNNITSITGLLAKIFMMPMMVLLIGWIVTFFI